MREYRYTGLSAGMVLAAILSWSLNHSILWCLFHMMWSWLYVAYYVLMYYQFVPK